MSMDVADVRHSALGSRFSKQTTEDEMLWLV